MLKKTIKYVDYNGEEREEDFYFNLTKPEVISLQLGEDGGMTEYISNIIKSKDVRKILEVFNTIISKSYGVKSPDGRRFMKSEELSKEFFETEAYPVLYMELLEDPKKASAFITNIMPPDMRPSKEIE